MKKTPLLVAVMLCLLCLSCGKSAQESRLELLKLNVEYSVDSFINRVEQGDAVVVDLFLRSGMNPNSASKDGETALSLAVNGRHQLIVETLIKAGADANRRNYNGYGSPLTAAAAKNETKIGRVLVNAGAQVKLHDALSYAVTNGSADMVRFLLPLSTFEDKSDRFRVALRLKNDYGGGRTFEDREAVITAFLQDKDGTSLVKGTAGIDSLIEAAEEGRFDIVELLINKGADVNATTKGWRKGITPLLAASVKSDPNVVEFLLKHGARTDVEGSRPALIAAIRRGAFGIVDQLLDHGADPNWHPNLTGPAVPCDGDWEVLNPSPGDNFDSRTPLAIAVSQGKSYIVRSLLQHGANPDVTGCEGVTMLSLAKDHETINVLKRPKP